MVVHAEQQKRKLQTLLDSNTGTMMCSLTCVHLEKCLDVVPNFLLFAQEGVARSFRPQPLNVAPFDLAPTTGVIAGGVGASLPARPAVEFLLLLIVLPTLPLSASDGLLRAAKIPRATSMCVNWPSSVLWQIPLHALLSASTLSDAFPSTHISKSAQPAKKPWPSLAHFTAA